jgi:phosphotransferase system HPr-like phosphotransfer protein
MDNAKGILKNAQDNFNNFAKSVSDSITGAFSFKDAKDAATETGQTFLQALTDQVTKTQDFTVKINRLLAAGLSEGALQQVLAAGQDAGGAIADELLAGGADAIGQANALTAKVQSLGASVGQNAATQFYQGGVDAGNALVAGISAVVSKYRIKLSSKGLSEKQLKRLQRNLGIDVDFLMSGGIPALADGGIVTGPTLALIGEAGPEAVVPLDRYNGGGGANVTINVNGGDPQSVVNALRTYMRQNGSVPIRVSNIF